MYLNVDFKYGQVLSLLELLVIGILFIFVKVISDLKKKKDYNLYFDIQVFFGGGGGNGGVGFVYLIIVVLLSIRFFRIVMQ